jgi:hypothetical protein
MARRCVWSRNLEHEEAKARYRTVKIQPQWVVTPGKQHRHMRRQVTLNTGIKNGLLLWWKSYEALNVFCAYGDALGWGTELQTGRPRVQFPIRFRPHCGPGIESASNINEYQEYFQGCKGGRCVGLTTLPPLCADFLQIWIPDLLETSEPLQACTGTVVLFLCLYTSVGTGWPTGTWHLKINSTQLFFK